jgi:dihydroorotate dehydrogenase (fumarate)
MEMGHLVIEPPLVNSANPWCTTLEQLLQLYACPHTGAVTTRTSLLNGFPHDESIHQWTFYDPTTHNAAPRNPPKSENASQTGSLNTLGYSPKPLKEYLGFIKTISDGLPKEKSIGSRKVPKPFIISVTGTVDEVVECYRQICSHQRTVRMPLATEINLSCPNIVGKPPPAYDSASLLLYLSALKLEVANQSRQHDNVPVPIGIKTPPYTYHDQYASLISALLESAKTKEPRSATCPISFITATNTLGSALVLASEDTPSLNSANSTGIGGLAGAPLHPLALGNVRTIYSMLQQNKAELGHIRIIGVGGVDTFEGYRRMRSVGATAVGVGTALGRKGVEIFTEIDEGIRRFGNVSKL